MDRQQLLAQARALLSKTGFFVSTENWRRGLSFDMVARRDDILLLIKLLLNVDALSESAARELHLMSHALEGNSLLVGTKSSSGNLMEGVVYSRFGIPIVSMASFREYLEEGVPPFIFSAPGGLYVKLDTDLLERARERGISLGQLAEVAHVSRRTIQMYLDGMSATVDAALRLEEFLMEPLVLPLDLFPHGREAETKDVAASVSEDFRGRIAGLLTQLGYEVLLALRSPFDAITKDQDFLLLSGMEEYERGLQRKAEVVSNLSRIVERDSVIFVKQRKSRVSLLGVPLIDSPELRKIRGREEIVELVEERKTA